MTVEGEGWRAGFINSPERGFGELSIAWFFLSTDTPFQTECKTMFPVQFDRVPRTQFGLPAI